MLKVTVEQIKLRSTLIRMFDSLTPIAIPNYIFKEAPILNYTNRKNIESTIIGLEYNSKLEQIKILQNNIGNYIIENTISYR